jgi:hypothetical protein
MGNTNPKVIILGHSFVKRLQRDLNSSFDPRARKDFKLRGTASVSLHGVGGRTVSKLRQFDLNILSRLRPVIVILEIGTDDLSHQRPEVVGSSIDDLVCHILGEFSSVRAIGVCHVIPRSYLYLEAEQFFQKVKLLNQYLSIVLEQYPNVFCWQHKQFNSIFKDLYLHDGVHLNRLGQYFLYRSYRDAILQALSMLQL